VRVEIKRLQDEGLNEATAQEIVYALAKFFITARYDRQNHVQEALLSAVDGIDDDSWDYDGGW